MKIRFYGVPFALSRPIKSVLGGSVLSRLFLIAFLTTAGFIHVSAQVTTTSKGTAVGGGYGISDFESINIYNGSLSAALPLFTLGGRGEVQFTSMLRITRPPWNIKSELEHYHEDCPFEPCNDHYRWRNEARNWTEDPDLQPGYGPGVMNVHRTGSDITPYNPVEPGQTCNDFYYSATLTRLTFTTGDGTTFQFVDQASGGAISPRTFPISRGRVWTTTDGASGATFVSDADIDDLWDYTCYIPPIYATGYLYLKNGITYRIENGGVKWIRDRNGNSIRFENISNGFKAIDPLNREITVTSQDEGYPYGFCTVITYKGLAGEIRKIRVGTPVSTSSPSAPFPELNMNGVFTTPTSSSSFKMWLHDGRSYQFDLNKYGELTQVVLPTGAGYQYDYGRGTTTTSATASANGIVGHLQQEWSSWSHIPPRLGIYRRLKERRVYKDLASGTLENKTVYELPVLGTVTYPPWVYPGYINNQTILIKTYDANGNPSNGSKHFFYLDPTISIQWDEFHQGNIPWEDGKEYQTDYFVNDGTTIVQRSLRDWKTKQTGSLVSDPRPSKQVSVLIENGNALAIMTDIEYDENGSPDPEYFSHLNAKKSKSYGYKALDLNTAQTGNIQTIAALFSDADLVSVSETDYLYDPNYKARKILSLPIETRVLNPLNQNDVLAKSQLVYDEAAYFDGGYTTVGWEDPNSTLRGNATTAKTWNKDTNTWIESHTMFDNFGNVRKVWDTSGDATRFVETEYSSTYNYAYPTKTKAPAPDPDNTGHGTTEGSEINRTYDFNTGLLLSVTDDRGQTATTEYDALLRPKRINPPGDGSISETVYNDSPGDIWVKRRQQIDAVNWAESTTYFDNLGRAFKSRTKDLQGDVMSQVKFDSFGRVEKTSNPYRVDSSGNPTETVYWSKPRYDERNRVVETYAPAPDGQTGISLGTVQFGISTLPNLIGTYVVATDPSGRKSRAVSGIHGLMRVDEATGIGGTVDQDLGTLASPNQPTSYSYNIKGELTKITQGDPNQSGQPIQHRYFLYDSFGRLIRVRQPEQTPNSTLATTGNPDNNSWTAGYSYDVFGNVISMTDAKGTTITNQYDKAGRAVLRTYSDGTPQVEFFYDGKGLPSIPQFSKGALTKAVSSVSEDRFTEFDNHGRLLASEQITDGQTFPFKYKYNLSGGLIEQQYPSGRIVRNFLDADGGLKSVTTKTTSDLSNKIVASNFDYSANGAVRKMRLGNGLWETAQIDHRGQLTQVGLGTTATNNDLFKVDYEYGELQTNGTVDATKNIGNIAKTTTTIPTTSFVQTFKYDSINRLTEAKETTGTTTNWTQNFGYDRFGNRTSFTETIGGVLTQNNVLNHPTIDAANNRFTTGQGYVYDFNGNIIQDAEGRTFTFNGDDKQTEVRNTATNAVIGQYFYDGSGARVKKFVPGGETTIFVYDAGGALAAEYSTVAPTDPTTSYMTTDHLGSPRVITDKTGNVIARRDFMPFGEELGADIGSRTTNLKYSYTGSDNIRKRFTGYEKDDETGLDFAEARMYQNKHGRFTAPDPLLASASAADPQTFNRYTYTGNNPINYADPGGLCKDKKTGVDDGNPCPNFSGQVYVKDGIFWAGYIEGGKPYNGPTVTQEAYGVTYQITGGANGGWQQVGSTAPEQGQNVEQLSAGDTSIGTTITPRDLIPLPCMSGFTCAGNSIPHTNPLAAIAADAPELKTITGAKEVLKLLQFLPGANVAATTMLIIFEGGGGNGSAAGSEIPNLIPGFKWLRKADKAKDGLTIIGETMTRVRTAAARNRGSTILDNMPTFTGAPHQITSQMMAFNRKWILQQLRSGRSLLDIGSDPARKLPSIFYQMEKNMIKNYQKLHPGKVKVISQ